MASKEQQLEALKKIRGDWGMVKHKKKYTEE